MQFREVREVAADRGKYQSGMTQSMYLVRIYIEVRNAFVRVAGWNGGIITARVEEEI